MKSDSNEEMQKYERPEIQIMNKPSGINPTLSDHKQSILMIEITEWIRI